MNNKKYEILMDEKNTIEWEGHTLHRIKALRDFRNVRKGDIGGYIENEYNLSQEGDCWIYDDAKAMDNSRMYDNSVMFDDSKMYDNSMMYDESTMFNNSIMYNNSKMYDESTMFDNSIMFDNSMMYNNSVMYNNSEMYNNSKMYDNSEMYNNSKMFDDSKMYNNSAMYDNSEMYDDSELKNSARLYGKLVSKVDDFVEISNPNGRIVTCVKKGDKILYNVGWQNEIDEETFKDRIENEDGGIEKHPCRKFYYKIIEASKTLLLNK